LTASRIALYRSGDPFDDADRTNQQTWMLEKMNRFKAVFAPRIRALRLDNPANDEDAEAPEWPSDHL
jgi:hypothetical protein